MKIAIIGAGAVGSFIAGKLNQAGVKAVLIGRSAQIEVIKSRGLIIQQAGGENVIPLKALPRLDQKYDVVIFATRLRDLEQAFQDNHHFLEHCSILTVQSGVQGANILSCHFEPQEIIDSQFFSQCTSAEPGVVHLKKMGEWWLGKRFAPSDKPLHAIAELLGEAFVVRVEPQIGAVKWHALLVDLIYGLPALIRVPVAQTYQDQQACRITTGILKEAVHILCLANIPLAEFEPFDKKKFMRLAEIQLDQASRSFYNDFIRGGRWHSVGCLSHHWQHGAEKEVDFLNGEVYQVARSMRMEAPCNRLMVDLVHEQENRAQRFSLSEIEKRFQALIA